jgi:PII-like signaling protein
MPMLSEESALLRIYVGEAAKVDGHPLYEKIVLAARHSGMAGATVLRGPMGFGRSHRLHTAKILDLSEDLPLVIEIVDSPTAIDAFLPVIEPLVDSKCLITRERVEVLRPSKG